jgi:hypothetical protein
MRIETDNYIIGHSSVCREDIVIAEKGVGRFALINEDELMEVIAVLQDFIPCEDNGTVNPDEFTRESLTDSVELWRDENLYSALVKTYRKPDLTDEERDAMIDLIDRLDGNA